MSGGKRAGGLEPDRVEPREITLRAGGKAAARGEILGLAPGGLVVVLVSANPFAAASDGEPGPEEAGAWLRIGPDGAVTAATGKVEFGQGIRTSLAQELAEELGAPLESVALIMGDTRWTPFDLGTFGSRSTPDAGTRLRRLGAAARGILIATAADRWGADRASLSAAGGRVTDRASGRSVGYGDLAAGRAHTEIVREDAAPTPAAEWTVAGTPAPRAGARDLVTGRHRYVSDLRRPGMVYGKVLRPASPGAALKAVDASAAESDSGVTVVRDGDFLGVVGPSLAAAARALASVQAMWTPAPGGQPDSGTVYDHLRRHRPPEGGRERWMEVPPHLTGDPAAALAGAAHRLARTYTTAYIAHVPLEPRAAVAEWSDDGERSPALTVWTGTQRPFAVRDQLAQTFGLDPGRVRVIVPDTGSGYGGKHTGECAVEAARLARGAGRPVKLAWSREEEFRWGYFRPAGVIDLEAGVDAGGRITAWTCDNYNAGSAAIRPWYAIPHQRVEFHPSDAPLRQGSYRGLAAPANHFAREMHVDELAEVAGLDPLELRLRNIDDPRLAEVFQAAAERFGWGGALPGGHGMGIAGGCEKGGYVATCAEVSVDRAGGGVKLVRALTAYDCGAVVNPDGLRNQIVGAFIQGIGGALFEAIDFDGGGVRNPRLSEYRVPRFSDVPPIEVVLLDRRDQPSFGAGETPMAAVAPAIGAAIFKACGVRPRSLPMARGGLPPPDGPGRTR